MKLQTSVSSRPSRRAWRPTTLLAWSAIAATAALSAGCGQKGPLMLPGAAGAKPAASPAGTPAATSPAAAASAPVAR